MKEAVLRQLVPNASLPELHVDDVYAGIRLPEAQHGRPSVVLNMVSTVDGKVALNGSAGGIGSRTDRRLMRNIRAQADAVMIGAGTLRAEICDPRVDPSLVETRRRRGVSSQPLAVAVSGSLHLEPTNRFLVNGQDRTVIVTTASAPADRQRLLSRYATIVAHEGPSVDLADCLSTLFTDFGVERLLCEGGPSLNQNLLDAGLIDEVFWTVAPKLAGGTGRTLIQGPDTTIRIAARMELVSLFADGDELFACYRLLRDGDGAYLT